MQGQRGAGNSFAEPIDLNEGSVSSNDGPNQPTPWNSMLYPMDNPNFRNFGGWHIGESSTSTNNDVHVSENLSRPLSNPTRRPLNINLNAEHIASGSDMGQETANAFPCNFENNDGASSCSLDDWSSFFKRKALDGGSSSFVQQGEPFDRHSFHASPPLHPSEELNLRIGIGHEVASDVLPPMSVTETGESSSRVNDDYDQLNSPSTRNWMSLADYLNHRSSSRPISPSDAFGSRQVSGSARNQPQTMHTPDLSRNSPPFPFHVGASSRASLTRNSREHSPFAHFSEMRNNRNISPENSRSSVPSPWGATQHHGPSRNPQRWSEAYDWPPVPSVESGPSLFPPMFSVPSSSEEAMMSAGANQGRHHHHHHYHHHRRRHHHTLFPGPSMRPSMMMDDIEGSQRLVSEICHVLNSMRRSDNLRDEDYMLFDPFMNGIPEFHDRHRDMRLDVDNMSYEELLALGERIGDVNTGLSEEVILRSMKQRKHLCLFDRSSSNLEPCSICQEEYKFGDDVGELDCGHDFHTDCVKQWLVQKNLCPICKMTALDT